MPLELRYSFCQKKKINFIHFFLRSLLMLWYSNHCLWKHLPFHHSCLFLVNWYNLVGFSSVRNFHMIQVISHINSTQCLTRFLSLVCNYFSFHFNFSVWYLEHAAVHMANMTKDAIRHGTSCLLAIGHRARCEWDAVFRNTQWVGICFQVLQLQRLVWWTPHIIGNLRTLKNPPER